MSLTIILAFFGLLPLCHSEGPLVVNVAKNGNDTADCLQGGKTLCLTIDYVFRNLLGKQLPSVKIVVSSSQTLPTSEGYISWTPDVTIVGKGKYIVFRCNDGVSLFLNFVYANQGTVRMKRINFENLSLIHI